MRILGDLVGKIYGKLKVIRKYAKLNDKHTFWECECDCGNKYIARADRLKDGSTTHCGCICNKGLGIGEAQFNALYSIYVRNASNRGKSFELSKKEFKLLTTGVCFYCGITPSRIWQKAKCKGHYIYNGVDRLDNDKGYTIDNSVSCCTRCNYLKSDSDYDEFINHIQKIYKNLNLGG